MKKLSKEECRFLNQMRDPEKKLWNSRAHYSGEIPFTAAKKLMSINKLIKLGLLSGNIVINPDKTFDYGNITLTESGKRELRRCMLICNCVN